MGDKTGISWTDATWNPIAGCSIVSPACTNCYAMAMAARIERMGNLRYAGLTQPSKAGPVWTGKIVHAPDYALHMPLRWKKPRRIFVNSMSDLFHEAVEDWKIAEIYGIMIAAHHLRGHTFQWLTKRSPRARKLLNDAGFWDEANDFATDHFLERCDPLNRRKDDARATCDDYSPTNPPPGIWAGATAEDATRFGERVPDLRATPAVRHFISYEPALGPLDGCDVAGLDWIIAGGESGPNARPSHPDWFRSLRDQCAKAGVPFFFKQWGEWGEPTDDLGRLDWPYHKDYDRTHWFDARTCARPIETGWDDKYHHGYSRALDPGVNLWETPEYLDQVARCPQGSCRATGKCQGNESRAAVTRVGKRRAGSLLDGVEHKAFPHD